MLKNVLNVIKIITVLNHLMIIILENVYVMKDIMMIMLIVFANSVQFFGIFGNL